jgi:uncharacterized protein (TIGR02594 family)
MTMRDIQTALKAAGFDPGPIDGIPGRRTYAAIKAFQHQNGLQADGIVGPATAAKLFKGPPPPADPLTIPSSMPWLQCAFQLIGTREHPGSGSNEAILGWAHDLEITSYSDDDIPWCGLFVAHCVGCQLPEEHLPASPLGARQWEHFGLNTNPQLGAIMVFYRESRTSGKGHVGLYWAEDDEAYHILGGNQSDSVRVSRIQKGRLLAARWPVNAPAPTGIRRQAERNGKISANEA